MFKEFLTAPTFFLNKILKNSYVLWDFMALRKEEFLYENSPPIQVN